MEVVRGAVFVARVSPRLSPCAAPPLGYLPVHLASARRGEQRLAGHLGTSESVLGGPATGPHTHGPYAAPPVPARLPSWRGGSAVGAGRRRAPGGTGTN